MGMTHSMQHADKIYVAGHRGLVGSAMMRALQQAGYTHLLCRTSAELDLVNQQAVNDFFKRERPDYIFLAAAKVGGIHANNLYRGEFIYQNLMIQSNVVEAARMCGAKRLLFLGSSCIYPREAPQPLREAYLLSGPLEPTNEPYAVAKIAGIKLCESYNRQYGTDFAAVMPTNLYGPHDNFDLETSHVLPALIRKIHEAKMHRAEKVVIWGTGTPRREFLHVDDLASACIFVMNQPGLTEVLNVGSNEEVSISELTTLICDVVGFQGQIQYDTSKPDGTLRKWLDTSKLSRLGWRSQIGLRQGIQQTYRWFCENISNE